MDNESLYFRENRPKKPINKESQIKARDQGYRSRYGITLQEYNAMDSGQGHVCKICKRKQPNGKRLVVDHNHRTGKVRRLLCHQCNVGLGQFDDNPYLVLEAFKYLKDTWG